MTANTWRPVPVRDKFTIQALRKMATGSEYAETGEWKCVLGPLNTFDLGTDESFRVKTCRSYHRSRKASELHCVNLARSGSS